jgi:predicted GH43/DUF377 family glycosyl hydrolase
VVLAGPNQLPAQWNFPGDFQGLVELGETWNRVPGSESHASQWGVLQNPQNEAVKVNGRFVMYLNFGLMAYSDDMIHWESERAAHTWPGGEGCFALADHDPSRPDDIILFTGGHHTGHFYAAGQVLLSKADPEKPLAYLPRPFLAADTSIPWENGFADNERSQLISNYADCIFFNGLTYHKGKWWLYYGGSEYYTCLATAP